MIDRGRKRSQRGQRKVDQPGGLVHPRALNGLIVINPRKELNVRAVAEKDQLVLAGATCSTIS